MTGAFRFRKAEWVAIGYLFYLSLLTLFLHGRPRADGRVLLCAVSVTAAIALLAWSEARISKTIFSIVRDWATLLWVLISYRSLDWFSPVQYATGLEQLWVHWDVIVIERWGLRRMIEASGVLIPNYLELCYLLTSSVGGLALTVFYATRKQDRAHRFLLMYVLGTLGAYALIPFFPTRPPRTIFPGIAAPHLAGIMRKVNTELLFHAGIHSGVFPSAHVSSTFGAAWGMYYALDERKLFGRIFTIYAVSVAVATVYGRYHYAIDALAGFAVSFLALVALRLNQPRQEASLCDSQPQSCSL
jgi:membrane-associated phospholipid phosphatase